MNILRSGTNTFAKILSLLVALVVWFQVTVGADFTTTANVPIRYSGTMRGLMVADVLPDHVTVRMHGSGKALLAWSMGKQPAQKGRFVFVDIGSLPAGKHVVNIRPDQVSLGAEGLEAERIVENDRFEVAIDIRARRTVSVRTDSLPGLKIQDGVTVMRDPVADPKYVTIEGPESIVRSVSSVAVSSLTKHELTLADTVLLATIAAEINPFVTVSPRTVNLHFDVEQLSELVFEGVPVRAKDFPANRFAFEPDSLTVTVHGPESILSRLRPRDIRVTVPYRSFLEQAENGGNAVKPVISFPKGITAAKLEPEKIRITARDAKG